MPSYGLLLHPEFGFAPVHGVEADACETTDGTLRFWQQGRLVYQIPAKYVAAVEVFAERADAMTWLREQARKPRLGRGRPGDEQVVAARGGKARQVGAVIEQVAVVVEDPRGRK